MIPLIVEVEAITLAAFALGMLFGYLLVLRRRNRRW